MKLPLGFGDVDFSDWLRDLAAAFISGGSGAVVSGITVNMLDPKDYNMQTGRFYILIASVFFVNGLLNMFAFLRTKPLPEVRTVFTAKTTEQDGQPVKTETTLQTTVIGKQEIKP